MIISDNQIGHYFKVEKWIKSHKKTEIKGDNQTELFLLQDNSDNKYYIRIREGKGIIPSWSIIFTIEIQQKEYRLARYNSSHTHGNKLEGTQISGFHIHKATERYQQNNMKIDGYAEETQDYTTKDGAIRAMVRNFNIRQQNNQILDKYFKSDNHEKFK